MLPVASVRDLGVSPDADAHACDEYSEIVVCSILTDMQRAMFSCTVTRDASLSWVVSKVDYCNRM